LFDDCLYIGYLIIMQIKHSTAIVIREVQIM